MSEAKDEEIDMARRMTSRKCKEIREFLRNVLGMEREVYFRLMKMQDQSLANDSIRSDEDLTILARNAGHRKLEASAISYHRKLIGYEGEAHRRQMFYQEWKEQNEQANQETSKRGTTDNRKRT